MAFKSFHHGTESHNFLNALQWDGWQEFLANFIGSFGEHAPEDTKEFIGDLIASHREHAPEGLKEFVDQLAEFWGHDEPVGPAESHEFCPADDGSAKTLGSASPDVSFFEMTGLGFGDAFGSGDQATATDLSDGPTENLSSISLDDLGAIDPADVKEFIGSLTEPFRAHAPDHIKEFFGHLAEALRKYAPEGLEESVDQLVEFLGHDERAATAQSHEIHAAHYEATGKLDFASAEATSSQTPGSGTPTATGSAAPVGTYNALANYLVNGQSWASTSVTVNISALDPDDQYLAQEALKLWADITPLNFTYVTSGADITFQDTDLDAVTNWVSNPLTGNLTSATINISSNWDGGFTRDLDSYRFQTFIHEIGHALGLGHQGPYDSVNGVPITYANDAIFANDSWQLSVMSYFDQVENTTVNGSGAYVLTPQIVDIIAIQSIYGAGDARPGDTIYGVGNNTGRAVYGAFPDDGTFPSVTIYDTGGVDTLNYSGTSHDQTINLAPEGFSSVYGETDNIIIARGTIIENATGGSGNDTFMGNDAHNVLNGGSGTDTAEYSGVYSDFEVTAHNNDGSIVYTDNVGTQGSDTLSNIERITHSGGGVWEVQLGTTGGDTLTSSLSEWDIINGGAGDDTVIGGWGDDWLGGAGGVDHIYGEGGIDHIDGGYGGDFLYGGDEADTINGDGDHDYIWGEAGRDTIDGGYGDDHIWGGDEVGMGDIIIGGFGNDTIDGGEGNDYIYGYGGPGTFSGAGDVDTIRGEGGEDHIYGGPGFDYLYGGGDTDFIYGGDIYGGYEFTSFGDEIYGEGGNDFLHGGANGDIIYGGTGIDYIYGDDNSAYAGVDHLYGESGDDTIYGDGGNDFLYGGADNDDLWGGTGNDTIYGGDDQGDAGVDTAYFSGNSSDYEVDAFDRSQSLVILDGPDGRDTLYGIETFQFADGPLSFDDLDPSGSGNNPPPPDIIPPSTFPTNEDTPVSGNLFGESASGTLYRGTYYTTYGGRLDVEENGNFTYTPRYDFNGTDTFINTIGDGQGGSVSFNVSFTVSSIEDAPVANTDMFMVVTGTTEVVGNVRANNGFGQDYDGDGDPLTVVDPGTHGTFNGGEVTIAANGAFTYRPPPGNFEGTDSFIYQVSDGDDVDSALAVFEIGPNIAPEAQDDKFYVLEDQEFSGNVLVNNENGADTDVNYGSTLSVVKSTVTTLQGVTVDIAANGDFTYTPPENFNGTDSFEYTLSDGQGGTDTATVTIEVSPDEDAPEAQNDTVTTAYGTAVSGNLFADNGNGVDFDADGDSLTVKRPFGVNWTDNAFYTIETDDGTVKIWKNGDFTYTPNPGFSGTDSFSYKVTSGEGSWNEDTAKVTIEVAPPDVTSVMGQTLSGNVLADNGSDSDGDLLFVDADILTTAQGGQVILQANGDFTFTPKPGFEGTDRFAYTVNDGQGGTDTAIMTISVTLPGEAIVGSKWEDSLTGTNGDDIIAGLGGDDVLKGADDWTSTGNDILLGGAGDDELHGNRGDDVLAGGDGADTLDGGGDADTFVFNAGESGVDTIEDYTFGEDVIDISGHIGDAFGVISSNPADFVRIVDPGGLWDPPKLQVDVTGTGQSFVTVAKLDGLGQGDTVTVQFGDATMVAVEIGGGATLLEGAPLAQDDGFTTVQGTSLSGNLLADNGNGADTDPDGGPLTVQEGMLETAFGGSVTILDNGDFTYAPPANFTGTDSFAYTVRDGQNRESMAMVTIAVALGSDPVASVNNAPIAADDAFSSLFDQTLSGNVLADNGNGADSDADGDPLTVSSDMPYQTLKYTKDGTPIIVTEQGGQVILQEGGDFTYTPQAGFVGTDSFTYTVYDGQGGTDTGTVTISVTLPDDAIVGTDGQDTLVGTNGNDTIAGLEGNDVLSGAADWRSTGSDTLLGGGGDDQLRGSRGDDKLDGGTGNDALIGSAGNDILTGGDGSDMLAGGQGADTFVFNANETGLDTIMDFSLGEDVIDISSLIGDAYGVVSKDLADFVQIVDPDGSKGDAASILQVDVTGTGDSFVDVAYLDQLNQGDEVSVMINSSMTSDIAII